MTNATESAADARVALLEATTEAVDYADELAARLRALNREIQAETITTDRLLAAGTDLYELTSYLRWYVVWHCA